MKNVLVTGGAGYVGGRLIPKLLECGFNVTVLDLFIFEPNLFSNIENDNLKLVRGDLRNYELVDNTLSDIDTVIHLGCLSNDPSCDLDEDLTRSINLDAGIQLIDLAIANNVSRFINASSASVYGIQSRDNVTEGSQLSPITLYAQYKVELEKYLHQKATDNFCPVTLRPATVCGYSPRLRLDLTVNILTSHAYFDKKITVFGGQQKRPNIHINDLIDIYLLLTQVLQLKNSL